MFSKYRILNQVIHQKPKKSLKEITNDLCPVSNHSLLISISISNSNFELIYLIIWLLSQALSVQQLYRISTMYWDDKYGTHSVSSDVSHQYGISDFNSLTAKKKNEKKKKIHYITFQVISNMRVMMNEGSNNAISTSFLLDDDSR